MDQRDAGHGAAFGQKLGGETGAVIHIESFGDAIGQEGLLEHNGQRADGLRSTEGMPDHHAGVIIDEGAKDGFDRAVV